MTSIFGGISVETPQFTVVKALGIAGAELRKYSPQVRAEVFYDAAPDDPIMEKLNMPFRSLAGYIFGGNTAHSADSSEKVAMTAPVVMQKAPEAEKIAMTAPVVMQKAPEAEKIAMTAPVVMQTGSPSKAAAGSGSGDDQAKRVMCFIMPSKYKSVADLPVPKDPRVKLVEVPERTAAVITFRGAMTAAVQKEREAQLRVAAEKESVKLSTNPHDVQYCAYNPPWCLPWLRTNDILIPVVE